MGFFVEVGTQQYQSDYLQIRLLMTVGQATGRIGAPEQEVTWELLRGCHHLLETALPPECLIVEHVYGHNFDPWNEFADCLARHEAQHGFFLPRSDLAIQKWRPIIPHLWMLFGQQWGLPTYFDNGLAIPPPDVPPVCQATEHKSKTSQRVLQFTVSFATANLWEFRLMDTLVSSTT